MSQILEALGRGKLANAGVAGFGQPDDPIRLTGSWVGVVHWLKSLRGDKVALRLGCPPSCFAAQAKRVTG
jgi:hypothetical protein